MNDTLSGLLTIGVLVSALAVVHVPLGNWLARTFTSEKHWRVEQLVYRVVGVKADSEQRWTTYAASVIAFSLASFVALFVLILAQMSLPLRGAASGMHVDTAFNTAISFVTNTNWQSYLGEVSTTPLTQTIGLTVQNFASAAVGLAVAVALVRGLARSGSDRLGNFWVDLTSGGSNLGPLDDRQSKAMDERRAALLKANPDAKGTVPADALTASASGLDPAVSAAYALWQVPRVASARHLSEVLVRQLVELHTLPRGRLPGATTSQHPRAEPRPRLVPAQRLTVFRRREGSP